MGQAPRNYLIIYKFWTQVLCAVFNLKGSAFFFLHDIHDRCFVLIYQLVELILFWTSSIIVDSIIIGLKNKKMKHSLLSDQWSIKQSLNYHDISTNCAGNRIFNLWHFKPENFIEFEFDGLFLVVHLYSLCQLCKLEKSIYYS